MSDTEMGGMDGTPKADDRQKYLNVFLEQRGPFVGEEDEWKPETLENAKVLVIGAGGLGCEILKNLALSGFKHIHVIDMDTIDVSNLNRQFLFRQSDVGKPKAEVAARFVEKRVRGVSITPYCGKIQDKDDDYYMQFDIVVCGLDSIEARRWINNKLCEMVDMNDMKSLKPLVDGGTEGFKGQARVIYPTFTSCIECQLDMHAPTPAVPLCTIATIPRQPSHCIEWAHQIKWEEERKDIKLDNDDPEHITWLYNAALQRAKEFNIEGVTYSLTQGVIKNIIPAIASTNAIIAAACCNEAFKIVTGANPSLGIPETNNYMMYTGDDSIYTYTFEHEKKDDCPVCGSGNVARRIDVDAEVTLGDFLAALAQRPDAQLKNPAIRSLERTLFYPFPQDLREQTTPNLKRTLDDLLNDGEEVLVTDTGLNVQYKYILSFREKRQRMK